MGRFQWFAAAEPDDVLGQQRPNEVLRTINRVEGVIFDPASIGIAVEDLRARRRQHAAEAMRAATVGAVGVGAGRIEADVALAIQVSIRRVAVSDGGRIARHADAGCGGQSLQGVVLVGFCASSRTSDLTRLRRQVAEAVICSRGDPAPPAMMSSSGVAWVGPGL